MAKSDPATGAAAVTPNDSTIVNARALYVGGAGHVAIVTPDRTSSVTFTAVPAGTILPVGAYKVMHTGTTATDIVALF